MNVVKKHHRKYLEIAAEENPNNARLSRTPNKGYLECVSAGWLEELLHPHAGYKYFALTKAGEAVRRQASPPPPPAGRELAMMKPRVAPIPSRLGSPKR